MMPCTFVPIWGGISSQALLRPVALGLLLSLVMPALAVADVLRWTGDMSEEDGSATGGAVLRYDRNGLLIRSDPAQPTSAEASGERHASSNPADLATVRPAIRLVAARYLNHPAITQLGLAPKQWSAFFEAMIKIESNYTQVAVSRAGALGLAQLMPGTAAYLGVDPGDPIQNLDGGARYLLEQMARFGSLELALAAYNAGPEAVRKYGGVPPYSETQSHIVKVMAAYDRLLTDI